MTTIAGVILLIKQDYSRFDEYGEIDVSVKQSSVSNKSYTFNVQVFYTNESSVRCQDTFVLQIITKNFKRDKYS